MDNFPNSTIALPQPVKQAFGVLATVIGLALCFSGTSSAATEELTLQAQYDGAFLEMYEDVGNLDKTFHFAELAIAVGDLEGAVAALERMLIIEPDLPQVRMQLGTLYFQMNSYAMSLTYLNTVIAHNEVPDDIKQGAQDLVVRIDELTSSHRFTGSVVGSVRYQSNANGGPMTQNIRLFGGSAVLDEQYTRQPDWDVSLAGQFNYVFDFETEPSTTLEIGLSAYSSKQDTQSQVDTTLFEAQLGPRLVFTPRPGTALDVRPYGLINDMALAGKDSFDGVGAGLDLNFRTSVASSWTLGARYVERDYDQVEESALKGPRTRVSAGKTFGLARTTIGTLNLSAFNEDTDENSSTYWEYGVQGVIQHIVSAPLNLSPSPWTISLTVGFYDKKYDEANPGVDSSVLRKDDTLRTSTSLVIPLNAHLNLLTTAGYTDVRSNLPNYTNENWFSSISLMGQF